MVEVSYQQIVSEIVRTNGLNKKLSDEMQNIPSEASETLKRLLISSGALAKHLKEIKEDITHKGALAPESMTLQVAGISVSWDI